MNNLQTKDPQIYQAIEKEKTRQFEGLELIPAENYVSHAVLSAMGSILTNKYSEGFAGRRYYGGNTHIDEIESLAVERAKKLFGVPFVNVQPYSGSPANLAVLNAVLNKGDSFSGLNLTDGGHLTHGWKVSATAKFFDSHPYHVGEDGLVDFAGLEQIVKEHKPKLIWCGATAYSRQIEFKKFRELADSIGAYLVADISHIAGLVVGGSHPSPTPYAHILTTTTHKTLRGPRGAMIMVTEEGLKKDQDLPNKINSSIFPGLQGGPHNHTTAAIAVALLEAATPQFKKYAHQIVQNTKTLEQEFKKAGIKMVSGGTDNHLLVLDLTDKGNGLGAQLEYALDVAHMTVNKNTIPHDPSSPYYPSGVRLGTPALTTRGFKEADMVKVADWIVRVIHHIEDASLPKEQVERATFLKDFKKKCDVDPFLQKIGEEIKEYTKNFPIPGITKQIT